MNQANFKTADRKGKIGERIIAEMLLAKGFHFYGPRQSGPHPFDGQIVDSDGKIIALCDVKTKDRRNLYLDTGINVAACDKYEKSSQINNLPFVLFFVDTLERKVFSGDLGELCRGQVIEGAEYPKKEALNNNSIIYFHLSTMGIFGILTQSQIDEIRGFDQRCYEYPDLSQAEIDKINETHTKNSREWVDTIPEYSAVENEEFKLCP